MNFKKILIDIFVITIAFLIFTIWYQHFIVKTVETTSPYLRFYKIYLITTDKEYQYWQFINQGAADMAASVGANYVWDAPVVRNVDQQIAVINRAVDNGADALLIAADDPRLISSAVEDAKARGVRIIYVDSPANEEAITTLATDNYKAGTIAGQTMITLLENAGVQGGSIGIVSIPTKENSAQRERGFRDAISADGRYTLLETVFTDGDPAAAKEAAVNLINEHMDLVGLHGTNEGTSEGVGLAIRENNNRFIGVGYDRTDAMVQLLNEGSLRAIINQHPYTMGYLGMAEAIAALIGKNTGPTFIDTGVEVILQRNE